jgi:TatD DNase family protein
MISNPHLRINDLQLCTRLSRTLGDTTFIQKKVQSATETDREETPVIDTHVHLQDQRYQADLEDVLQRAHQSGITELIIPGTNLASSEAAIHLASRYSDERIQLYAAVGFHPTEAHKLTQDNLNTLYELAQHASVVAIGEIGLDDYWPNKPNRGWKCATPETQRRAFQMQMGLAAELGLPIIVHDRDAHDDTLRMLRAWTSAGSGRRGTLHAYAAGIDRLQQALDTGCFIGVDGPVTFKNASALREVARAVPLDRLLLETDGPYLTPVPHRGERNEPAYLNYVAQRIAELKEMQVSTIVAETTRNARALFGLPQSETPGS